MFDFEIDTVRQAFEVHKSLIDHVEHSFPEFNTKHLGDIVLKFGDGADTESYFEIGVIESFDEESSHFIKS